VKRTTIGSASYYFLGNAQAPTGTNGIYLGFGSDTLFFGDYATSGWDWYVLSSSLYRDTSAWYHVVAQYDTTQATASERVKLYVNGVRLTAFDGASTYPTPQNVDGRFNQASVEMAIGRLGTYNGNYFDGYMSEVNFIDGQALDSSSFGYTDSITGSWMPKKYVGTYGTNGFYLPFQNQSTTANYFTYSEDFSNVFWTKYQSTCVTNATTAPNGTNTADKMVINNGQILGQFNTTGSATDNQVWTSSVYLKALDFTTGVLYIQKKDTSYAYIGFDLATGNITDGINGATGTITSVGDGWYRVTCTVNLGTGAGTTFTVNYQFNAVSGDGVKGSYIWGAQLEQGSSAGPYMYTVTSVQNPTLALGEDRSLPTGGYNNWVATNLSVTSGAGNDSLLDSPTDYGNDTGLGGEVRGNYATLNPLFGNIGGIITDGNLTLTHTGGANGKNALGVSSIAMSTGKWYCEFTNTAASNPFRIGIISSANTSIVTSGNPYISQYADGYSAYVGGGTYKENNNIYSTITNFGGSSPVVNDIYMVALDLDNNKVWFGRNGSWANSGNPASGTTETYSILSGLSYYFACNTYSGDQAVANFGQRPFAYTAPTGFKALCTQNLTTPTIKKSKSAFDAVTYNGTGSTFVSPSGLAFAPDLVWVKSRSQNISHVLSDTVRGTGEVLCSNNTRAGSPDSFLTNFNQDGFTLNTSITANNSGSTYVAWAWQASSTSSTNTNGSITSTVRANPQAGFSIVSFVNASGTNQETVGHGLGVVPKMIIAKNRDTNVNNWGVYHSSVCDTTSKFLRLNTTDAVVTFSTVWGASLPTPSVFGVTGGGLSVASVNMIAYCFAEIDGYSKFGSYAGNASTDGPFVYCGFRPRFLMIKRTDSAEPWIIKDTARSIYNGYDVEIYPNYSNTEGGPYSPPIMDYVSNGFKLRSNTTASNNGTIIFAAFAESPFKYARAK